MIVGSGSLEADLIESIASKPYRDDVFLAGDVPHPITLHLVNQADILLRTTRFDGDAISIREALFLGTPVIATDNQMRPDGLHLIAIADKPAILLLDEPFSHLDLPNRLIVSDLLFDMVRQDNGETRKTSCIIVTHDATDALSIANSLGIMRDGKLIQIGSPVDIYHRPITAYAARMTGPVNILKARPE